MRKQVTRLWRWSRNTVRFADLSISRGVTLSRPSRTFGSQRFVGYSVLYKWVFLLEVFPDPSDSNLLCYMLFPTVFEPSSTKWASDWRGSEGILYLKQFTSQSLEIMNIELESKINLLNLKPGLLFFMYLCNIELSYDLSLQIFKYLDSIDVDDSDVKAGYSIHLVSIISYSQLQFPHWFTCIYLFNFKNLAELLWEPILWRHKAYKDLFLCWWWNNHNKSFSN